MPDDTTPPAPRPVRKRASGRANTKPSTSSKRKPTARARKAKPFVWPKITLPRHLKTTVLLFIAVVALGTYISLYELRQPTNEELEYRMMSVAKVPEESVTRLTLDLPQAKFSLSRDGAAWRFDSQPLRADADRVRRVLGAVDPLRADRVLAPTPDQPLDPAAYGLNPAVGSIIFTAGAASTTLQFGEPTPVPGQRYAKLPEKPEIFIIPGSLFDDANQTAETYRDPLLLRFDIWSTDRLAVKSGETELALARTEKAWRLEKPIADQADRTEVNRLLTDLSQILIAQVEPALPQDKKGRSQPAFDPAVMEVAITLQGPRPGPPGPDGVVPEPVPQEPVTVSFGEPLPDDPKLIYAKRSDETTLYAVDSAVLEKLKRDPHGLRSKAVMEFFTNVVTKAQVVQGEAAWTVERKEGAWVDAGSGGPLDTKQVDNWLSSLADLRLAGFVDDDPSRLKRYDLDPPQATISIWTLDRDEPQRLFIGGPVEETGNRYARIEGREAVVRLPDFITQLLSMDLDDFQPIVSVPSTEAGTVSGNN